MKKIVTVVFLFLLSFFAKAQSTYPQYVSCVDSSRINIYYQCTFVDYNPVCGCDGVTYRNSCAADNVGGLITSHNYQDGICGNFDFDFVPNPIVPGSPLNSYGTLSIYTKTGPVSVLVQIFDVFARQWYLQQITIAQSPPATQFPPVYMDGFPQGIYYLFITINGETKHTKIMKANLQ